MPDPDSAQSLSWSFNPWKQSLGGWRRPQVALPLSLLLAALLSWSVTFPNMPASYEQRLEQNMAELGSAPFAVVDGEQVSREQLEGQLEQIRRQREQFPLQWLMWGLVSALLLLGMNASLYLPVHYRLDERGVTVTFLGVPSLRRWEHYRNYYAHRHLVHLTTMPRPSPLDPFRGHSLLFAGNREEVLAFIGRHVEKRNSKEAGGSSQEQKSRKGQ